MIGSEDRPATNREVLKEIGYLFAALLLPAAMGIAIYFSGLAE